VKARRRHLLVAAGAIVLVAGCSRGTVHDAGKYCTMLGRDQADLVAPIADEQRVHDALRLYDQLAGSAPLAVDDDWSRLDDLMHAANEIDLNDNTARQALIDQTYAADRSARRIAQHAKETCGISLSIAPLISTGNGQQTGSTLRPPSRPPASTTVPPATTVPAPTTSGVPTATSEAPTATSTG
jgi:hypothetical protein